MSTKAVGWALEQHVGLDPTAKLVLIALAEAAHLDDACAWLGNKTLAEIALVKQARTASSAIDKLIALGLVIQVEPGTEGEFMSETRVESYHGIRADHRPRLWHLNGVRSTHPDGARYGAATGRATARPRGATATAPEPKQEPTTNRESRTVQAATDWLPPPDFDADPELNVGEVRKIKASLRGVS